MADTGNLWYYSVVKPTSLEHMCRRPVLWLGIGTLGSGVCSTAQIRPGGWRAWHVDLPTKTVKAPEGPRERIRVEVLSPAQPLLVANLFRLVSENALLPNHVDRLNADQQLDSLKQTDQFVNHNR